MTLHRIPTLCPVCFWKAALRAYPEMVLFARGLDPETPLLSLRCSNRRCGQVYPVTALDFQRAVAERRGAKDAAA